MLESRYIAVEMQTFFAYFTMDNRGETGEVRN